MVVVDGGGNVMVVDSGGWWWLVVGGGLAHDQARGPVERGNVRCDNRLELGRRAIVA